MAGKFEQQIVQEEINRGLETGKEALMVVQKGIDQVRKNLGKTALTVAAATALTACGSGGGEKSVDQNTTATTANPIAETAPVLTDNLKLNIPTAIYSKLKVSNIHVESDDAKASITFPFLTDDDIETIFGDKPFDVYYFLNKTTDVTKEVSSGSPVYVGVGNHSFRAVIVEQGGDPLGDNAHERSSVRDYFGVISDEVKETPAPVVETPAPVTTTVPAPKPTKKPVVVPTDTPNTLPVAVADKFNAAFGQTVTVNLAANDTDPDGPNDELEISAVAVTNGNATVSNNNDGTITIVPDAGFSGKIEGTYTIRDIDGGTAPGTFSGIFAEEIINNVTLSVDGSSVEIEDATYAYGTTPMVTIPTLKVNASDGGVAVTYTLNGEVKADGATVNAQAGENTLVVVATELGGDKETATIPVSFEMTEEDPVDVPTDFSGLGTFDGPRGTKGLQGTITDPDGVASVRIDYSDGTYSLYSDGNINNASTRLAGTTYTITVTDDNGVVKTYDGTL